MKCFSTILRQCLPLLGNPVSRIQHISTTIILGNFKFSVTLLSVRGLIFNALKQPFISLATSSSILASLLALQSQPLSLHANFW